MKRFFALLAVGAIFAISEPAQAQSPEDPHSIGTVCLTGDFFDTQGECASWYATVAVVSCTEEDQNGVPAWVGLFKNQGECVSFVTLVYRELLKG